MARPRIFISSTFYDLRHVREDVARFVRDQGYEPVLFERGDVSYGRAEAPQEYCYKEIELSDILISIVGGRYGTESSDRGYSVSQKELRHALEQGKQVYIFVEKKVRAEYETYKINKDVQGIQYRHVDNSKVYEFLDELESLPRNNPIFEFEMPQDIVRVLREQWAGLFQRLLQEEADKPRLEMIQTLKATVSSLQQMVTSLINKADISISTADIVLFNHPAFARVQDILNVKYRMVFLTLEELNEIFEGHGFTMVPAEQWDYPNMIEWMNHSNFHGTTYLIRVSRGLFDETGLLKPLPFDQWDETLIRFEYESKETAASVVDINDDDLPF